MPEWKRLADTLRDAVKNNDNLSQLPLECARMALNSVMLDTAQKKKAVQLARQWTDYAVENEVPPDNPFAIRYHAARFAKETFGHEVGESVVCEVDIHNVIRDGVSYEGVISAYVDPAVLSDEDVAIVGGAARLALKMHAGVAIENELPINDVDAVISASTDVSAKATRYGIDLTGAKIVDGDISSELTKLITNFDCTMNQAAVYKGKLIFTEQGLADIREGNIRLIAKNDPLFGVEGHILPDGNVYLNKSGFYRGLSFLLRDKGKRLIVSKENIELERNNIGRYWLIMLLVKLMPMKDQAAKYEAIGHWHEIAQRIGCTESADPEAFFRELMNQYPETHATNTNNGMYDIHAQTRWIIGKLTSRSAEAIAGGVATSISPPTYTPADIVRAESIRDYDFESFVEVVSTSK